VTRRPSQRRRTEWADTQTGSLALAANVISTVDLLADFETRLGVTAFTGFTIARIKLRFTWRPDADVVHQTELGIGVFDGAVTAQTPATNVVADWMYPYIDTHQTAAPGTTDLQQHVFADIKSQRKLQLDDILRMYIRGTTAWHLSYHVRVLVLLP
jgi:hypothetical protein